MTKYQFNVTGNRVITKRTRKPWGMWFIKTVGEDPGILSVFDTREQAMATMAAVLRRWPTDIAMVVRGEAV